MEEAADTVTSCPRCGEKYEDNGGRLPRLLPCSHSACETCLGECLRRTCLVCGQCGKKHKAYKKAQTFPPNQYILCVLKVLDQILNQNVKPVLGTIELLGKGEVKQCPKHQRDLSLRCNDDTCGVDICQLCLIEYHIGHNVVDILQERDNMKRVDHVLEDLSRYKEKLVVAKDDLVKNCTESLEKLEERKCQCEAMIERTKNELENVRKEIEIKIKEVGEEIEKVNKMRDTNASLDGIENAENVSRSRKLVYQYLKFKGTKNGLGGQLLEERLNLFSQRVISTFQVPGKSKHKVCFKTSPTLEFDTI